MLAGNWKRFLLVTPAILLCGEGITPAAEARLKVFRAGAYVVDISPVNYPVIVNAMFTERSATNAADRLHARALVLDDGSTRIAIAVVDSCMVPRDLIDAAKEQASRSTGIPVSHMLVSATHTHSAPSAMGCLGSRADTNYQAFLPSRIAEAITGATRALTPARIGWAVVEDWEHTFNRRWIRRPDKILNDPFGHATVRANMHPGHESPDAIGPSGPVDPALSVLALQSPDGVPLALLANYSQHYYGSPLLSSDYFGRFTRHIAQALNATNSAFVGIMSQGTSGDLMWMDYGAPRREIGYDAYAREMAGRALEAYRAVEWHNWVPLKVAERTLSLRYRAPDEARRTWARKFAEGLQGKLPQTQPEIYALEASYLHERPQTELKLQAIRIGDLGIAAIPNEVFAITGLKLKAQSPLTPLINIELANGAEGYIPPPEQHRLGGYTTWPARTAGLEVQAEPKIVAALLGLLAEISGKPPRNLSNVHGAYAATVLKAEPIAYWRLNEVVIPTAYDSSRWRHHATFEDGVVLYLPGVDRRVGFQPPAPEVPNQFTGDIINRAAHFAGGRMRAELPTLPTWSVELWFWNGLANEARPLTGYLLSRGRDGDAEARGDHLGLANGKLIFSNSANTNRMLWGQTDTPWRRWHHVVLTRDGTQVTTWLNGTREFSGEAEITLPKGVRTLFIGGRCDGVSNFEGRIDEVAVYYRVLSAAEIRSHHHAAGVANP
jgi:concanavalin A-like lectin/glucanase superfamily protein